MLREALRTYLDAEMSQCTKSDNSERGAFRLAGSQYGVEHGRSSAEQWCSLGEGHRVRQLNGRPVVCQYINNIINEPDTGCGYPTDENIFRKSTLRRHPDKLAFPDIHTVVVPTRFTIHAFPCITHSKGL